MLVQLRELHFPRALVGFELLQIFGELPHQIAPRNPDRQRDLLLRRRVGNRQCNAKQMTVQVRWLNVVVNGGGFWLAG